MSKLTLIPTPISDSVKLCETAKELLLAGVENGALIAVEEHKVARRRWLGYELPREAIDNFVIYNEHTYEQASKQLLSKLKDGVDVFLLSDCGLPAFCDPGRLLVEKCHHARIKITAAPFANSIALAVALSGFSHDRFMFEGFIPAKKDVRSQALKRIIKQKHLSVLMDTPYRLGKLLSELEQLVPHKEIFLACDLNKPEEFLFRGSVKNANKLLGDTKKEFILLLGANHE